MKIRLRRQQPGEWSSEYRNLSGNAETYRSPSQLKGYRVFLFYNYHQFTAYIYDILQHQDTPTPKA